MNVIIIPLAGHYRRFLFLFLYVNLFKKKLFVTTICSLKINKPIFFQETLMVKLVLLALVLLCLVGLSFVDEVGARKGRRGEGHWLISSSLEQLNQWLVPFVEVESLLSLEGMVWG